MVVTRTRQAPIRRTVANGLIVASPGEVSEVDQICFHMDMAELLISFVDGSTMTVTIVECNSLPLHEGARISQISED
jgi:hypothetical protein